MKKIPVTVQIPIPETLAEAIKMYGPDEVYKDYLRGRHLDLLQKMHAAGKIRYEP